MSPENVQEDLAEERLPASVAFESEMSGGFAKPDTIAFKFGGSSLLGAPRMLHSACLVRDAANSSQVAVIVSAMKGVTDRLLAIGRWIEAGNWARAHVEADAVIRLHLDVLSELQLEEDGHQRMRRELQLLGRDLLHDVSPREQPGQSPAADAALHDRLASYGERFSARLFAAALEKIGIPAVPVSSSDFLVTCDTFRNAKPDMSETRRRGREILLPLFENGLVPVITGFLGATPDGRTTTLGRNSSDYSGAIIAHVIDAAELVIWTDVDGVFTANPRESAEASLLHELSYDEAHALAASGARVLHPKVLPLAAESEMVVWVRNTFRPDFRGTRIGPAIASSNQRGAA
jgi:aspartate kinase